MNGIRIKTMEMRDDLRGWLAENIIMGCAVSDVHNVLVGLGIPADVAQREIGAAMTHPYVETGRKFYYRLQKREAILKTYDSLLKSKDNYINLQKQPLPPFKEFLDKYYYENQAAIFTGAIDHWPAAKWTPKYLLEKVGPDAEIEIQHGREKDKNYETQSEQFRKTVKLGDFIGMIESTEKSNDFYLTANNNIFARPAFKPLVADIGQIGDGYLKTDQTANSMFLWLGPAGIVTPLHHDLTNNLFVQVYGQKTFRLIPSAQVPYMYNNLHVFSDVDMLAPDLSRNPNFAKVTPITITIKAGEVLFIPIGWFHHVVGDTVSISLTFTNFNLPSNNFVDYPSGSRY